MLGSWTLEPWALRFRGPSIFDLEEVRGLRVIIIGPAETVAEDLRDTAVDEYDVVVRLNNGLLLVEERPEIVGHRTDLLFHNLQEDGNRSAGTISAARLRERGVRTVIYPHWRRTRPRGIYWRKLAEMRRHAGPPVKLMPLQSVNAMRHAIGGRTPTTGTSAVLFFLDSPAAELAIHGFTFFETVYVPGYNEAVRSKSDARLWVVSRGTHDPSSEKAAIRARLRLPHAPKVTLGRHVRRHLLGE